MAQLGAEPTVQHFNEIVINLPENEKAGFVKGTFGLAFSEWGNLNVAYREFLVALIKSKRQQFVEFVRKDTVLGEFLYDLKDKELEWWDDQSNTVRVCPGSYDIMVGGSSKEEDLQRTTVAIK